MYIKNIKLQHIYNAHKHLEKWTLSHAGCWNITTTVSWVEPLLGKFQVAITVSINLTSIQGSGSQLCRPRKLTRTWHQEQSHLSGGDSPYQSRCQSTSLVRMTNETAMKLECQKLAWPAYSLSMEISDCLVRMESKRGAQKFNASGQMYPCHHRQDLVRTETIPLFRMPLLTWKKYSKFMASNPICPGQDLDAHLLFSFYFTSLCFSLSHGYTLYFGAFSQDLKIPEASFSASGYEANLLLQSITWSPPSLTLSRKMKLFIRFGGSPYHCSKVLPTGLADIPHYQCNAIF